MGSIFSGGWIHILCSSGYFWQQDDGFYSPLIYKERFEAEKLGGCVCKFADYITLQHSTLGLRPGMSNMRPVGQIRPAEVSNPAHFPYSSLPSFLSSFSSFLLSFHLSFLPSFFPVLLSYLPSICPSFLPSFHLFNDPAHVRLNWAVCGPWMKMSLTPLM